METFAAQPDRDSAAVHVGRLDRVHAGRGRHPRWVWPVVVALIASTVIGGVVIAPSAAAPNGSDSECPALYVLGVQGAGENAMGSDSTIDSGALGEIVRPLVTGEATGRIDRGYVEFDAVTTGTDNEHAQAQYENALDASTATLNRLATDFLARCPASQLAVAGYREGAAVAAQFARRTGAGTGAVPAERVAGVALLSDPSRQVGAAPVPGRPGQARPDPAAGTTGDAVGRVAPLSTTVPARGGGIAGPAAGDFGALAGRVVSLCTPGDLSCDTSNEVPIQQVVTNIASSAEDARGDPLRALASVTQALAFTAINSATAVVNNDIQGNSLASLSYQPGKSISQRLAEASDPRTPIDVPAALHAVLRVGTIGLNAVVTVARQVITPQNIAEIAAAGLADPAAALLVLGQKLLGALPALVPPTTVVRLVGQAFDAVIQNITDNTQLINTTTTVKYSDELDQRASYTTDTVSTDGATATRFVSDWLAAAAADIAATTSHTATAKPTLPSATR
ncbi:hypothetical protein A9X06_19370 [Mycobacterium sp. 852002-51759_SCH5129042]|nr:hypothetical protein A9X06_19370 [Mycobacterium sp. 852002-51759_SCH5129042]